MQLSRMYSIPWDMGRSGQSWHKHATCRMGDRGWPHMCWLNAHLYKPPSTILLPNQEGEPQPQSCPRAAPLSGDMDNEGWKIFLSKGLSTMSVTKGSLE